MIRKLDRTEPARAMMCESCTPVTGGSGSRNGGTMNRSAGMGLLVFGIVLGVVGAIMRFAVKDRKSVV